MYKSPLLSLIVPVSAVLEAGPVNVPPVCPTIAICSVLDRLHVNVPCTDPRITTSRTPVGTEVLGRLPLVEVTTMVSVLEAQWPSVIHTPGPMAVHSLSAVHARQVFVVVLQIGVVPEHVVLSTHATHAPLAAHAGRIASTTAHWLEDVHPAHVWVAVEQIGVVPEQLALVRHSTHLFVVVSQTGVPPEQVELSVHCTHAPVAAQAGLVASAALHWAAVAQAPQVAFAVLQMGVAPEQLPLVRHCTHLLVAGSQTGVAPEHVELSTHCTHAPVGEHAG